MSQILNGRRKLENFRQRGQEVQGPQVAVV